MEASEQVIKEATYVNAVLTIANLEKTWDVKTLNVTRLGREFAKQMMMKYFGTADMQQAVNKIIENERIAAESRYMIRQLENDTTDRQLQEQARRDRLREEYAEALATLCQEAMREIACSHIFKAISRLDRGCVKRILYEYAAARGLSQPETVEAQLVLRHLDRHVATQVQMLVFNSEHMCPAFDLDAFEAQRTRLKLQLQIGDTDVSAYDDECNAKLKAWLEDTLQEFPVRVDLFLKDYAPLVYSALEAIYYEVKTACDVRQPTLDNILREQRVSGAYVRVASLSNDIGWDSRVATTRYVFKNRAAQALNARIQLVRALYEIGWRSVPSMGAVATRY